MADPLDKMIADLRGLRERAKALLPEIAREVKAVLAENIAAERGPDGTPWPATKDGGPALKNAAENLSVQAVGGSILCTLHGPEARHHLGIARGRVKRPILPSRGIPAPIATAIGRVIRRALA